MLPVLPSGLDQIFLNEAIFGVLTGTRISSFFFNILGCSLLPQVCCIMYMWILGNFLGKQKPSLKKVSS